MIVVALLAAVCCMLPPLWALMSTDNVKRLPVAVVQRFAVMRKADCVPGDCVAPFYTREHAEWCTESLNNPRGQPHLWSWTSADQCLDSDWLVVDSRPYTKGNA